MGHGKKILVAALVGLIIVCAGVFALVVLPHHSAGTSSTHTSAPVHLPSGSKALTAADATQLLQNIEQQVQQAMNTPDGPKAITPAEAQAIVNGQQAKLGIKP